MAILLEAVLEGVGFHQHLDRHFAGADAALKVVSQLRDGFGFALHLELDHLLEEDALEFVQRMDLNARRLSCGREMRILSS
ncbi:MAG TPA: hypothetical protein VK993_04620 [Chthoniobacterales bacterium]|nr:hypothetical protein [Chthoniobacterales bacterium]